MDVKLNKLGANFTCVDLGDLSVWFSYETPIAFEVYGQPRVVRENIWGPTTGKHLNAIDGGDKEAKARRVSSDEFNRALVEGLDCEEVCY